MYLRVTCARDDMRPFLACQKERKNGKKKETKKERQKEKRKRREERKQIETRNKERNKFQFKTIYIKANSSCIKMNLGSNFLLFTLGY